MKNNEMWIIKRDELFIPVFTKWEVAKTMGYSCVKIRVEEIK